MRYKLWCKQVVHTPVVCSDVLELGLVAGAIANIIDVTLTHWPAPLLKDFSVPRCAFISKTFE